MEADSLFQLCNVIAIIGWLLLIFVPRWSAPRLLSGLILPALLSVVYLVLILIYFGRAEGGFGSLDEVAKLFQNRSVLLAGWIHYLAFDLFIGAWETRDAERNGVSHFLVIPCLLLTFLFGPIGVLLYLALRTWRTRGLITPVW
jgi:Domain of unknown function (DUF4281)